MTKSLSLFLIGIAALAPLVSAAEDRPNILWISSEDNGPHLGCYGDSYATTPHLDKLAKKGMRFLRASSNAPVCAPARTTIISGIYPPSSGSEHMRSEVRLPENFKMFPQYLREAGYYTTNRSKEDYNLTKPGTVWDEKKGHWKNRKKDQPFFSVFNFTISHESKIRNEISDSDRIHDPAKVRVPAYHPDTPEVRKDWAQYYDRLTMMDAECGAALGEIEKAGLSEDTIIFYWGDHGSGMPRNKRWPYNSGLHVPMICYFPDKWKHLAPKGYDSGGTSNRMVGFVDLAPTMLSIAGIEPRDWMQGEAFAGKFQKEGSPYSYGFRGRMDERYDLVRTVMSERYVYIRQYMPHRIYGQYIQYMFATPTTQVWHRKFHDNELNQAQSHFWQKKPSEELYDLQNDPDEVNNLADSADHKTILDEMRNAHRDWEHQIRDIGFLPEAEIHSRSIGSSPYEMGHDKSKYDFDSVFAAADLASSTEATPEGISKLEKLFESKDSAVRYWGAMGLLMLERAGFEEAYQTLLKALDDPSASVAIVAAESLGRFGSDEDIEKALAVLMKYADQNAGNIFEAILANNALDYLDKHAASQLEAIKELPTKPKESPPRVGGYVGNLLNKTISDLEQ